ncbi:hypothetical protein ACH5RR_039495 [Cinchona calisaya]|uniref:Uncharacterized protein n=1 Tax=Cinchona calisaya TaxID=153742 RepID=A0ABD2Y3H9_9GENT
MDNVKARLDELETQLESILDEEEMLWKQRSKQHWYKDGDWNTRTAQQATLQAISSCLGIPEVDSHQKYRRLPSIVGRRKAELFSSIKGDVGYAGMEDSYNGRFIVTKIFKAKYFPNSSFLDVDR